MFQELTASIQADIVANMFRVEVRQDPPPPPARPEGGGRRPGPNGGRRTPAPNSGVPARSQISRGGSGSPAGPPAPPVPEPAGLAREKIGRNDPCWCGSGRKYKRCHGR